MQGLPKSIQMLPGEEVLAQSPYRPFSVLTITNMRIIGRKLFRFGPRRFEGSIFLGKVTGVEFSRGSWLLTPSLLIHFSNQDGEHETARIQFPGFTARAAGYDPEAIYRLIKAQLAKSHGADTA